MADYYCQFSCIFDVGSAENAAQADSIRGELAAELDRHEGEALGFEMTVDHETGPGTLWLHSADDGEPEHVIRFVLRCAEAFDLNGRWAFSWSLSCNRPRVDAFGGGARLIDLTARVAIDWIDCSHWVSERTKSDPDAPTAAEAPASTAPGEAL